MGVPDLIGGSKRKGGVSVAQGAGCSEGEGALLPLALRVGKRHAQLMRVGVGRGKGRGTVAERWVIKTIRAPPGFQLPAQAVKGEATFSASSEARDAFVAVAYCRRTAPFNNRRMVGRREETRARAPRAPRQPLPSPRKSVLVRGPAAGGETGGGAGAEAGW